MREILFRGKRLDNGEWMYGSFCMDALEQFNGLCGVDGFIRLYDKAKGKMQTYEVDRETVGQYTGLKDKNGKKVFEGDIVRKTNKGRHPEIFIANIRTCFYTNEEVYYGPFDHFTESCEYEVIGNIHDNKLEDFDNGR